MSKFINKDTGVVVSVADEKDARFTDGWDAVVDEKPAARSKKSESSDSK
jgi:hypothetical protein